jgi:hypothetical protein
MSGDIRTREITHIGKLPFNDDLVDIRSAIGLLGSQLEEISLRPSINTAERIKSCINKFLI